MEFIQKLAEIKISAILNANVIINNNYKKSLSLNENYLWFGQDVIL